MLSLSQLRKNFEPVAPHVLLNHLAGAKLEKMPLLTVTLASGHSFKGYLVGASGGDDPSYCFSLQIQNEGDGAADLCYAPGRRIEAVTVWNVDDYPGALPMRAR